MRGLFSVILLLSCLIACSAPGFSQSEPPKAGPARTSSIDDQIDYLALKAAQIVDAQAKEREARYWAIISSVFGGLGILIVGGLTWMGWRTRQDLRVAAIQELEVMLRDEERIRSQIGEVAAQSVAAVQATMQVEIAVSRLIQLSFELTAAQKTDEGGWSTKLREAIMRNYRILAESSEGLVAINERLPSLTHAMEQIVPVFARANLLDDIQEFLKAAPFLLEKSPAVLNVLGQAFGRRYVGILPSQDKEDEKFMVVADAASRANFRELLLPYRLARVVRDDGDRREIESLIHDIYSLSPEEQGVAENIILESCEPTNMATKPSGLHFVAGDAFTKTKQLIEEIRGRPLVERTESGNMSEENAMAMMVRMAQEVAQRESAANNQSTEGVGYPNSEG